MASNAKYTSPMFQNEILAIASNMIVQEIVTEANKSFVSVIANESCDISGKEQLSIVLRYMIGKKSTRALQDLLKWIQFQQNQFHQVFWPTYIR